MGVLVDVTDANFCAEVLSSPVPTLLCLSGPECPACRTLDAALAALAGRHAGDIKVARADVSACRSLPRRLGVAVLPTVIVFAEGREQVRRRGVLSGREAEELLRAVTEGIVGGRPSGR